MKTQREKFEEWFFANIDANTFVEDLCWQAWCAAIDSIVVELPLWFHTREGGQAYGVGDVRQAIEKAGAKCK